MQVRLANVVVERKTQLSVIILYYAVAAVTFQAKVSESHYTVSCFKSLHRVMLCTAAVHSRLVLVV
jgi:hypothetical protein